MPVMASRHLVLECRTGQTTLTGPSPFHAVSGSWEGVGEIVLSLQHLIPVATSFLVPTCNAVPVLPTRALWPYPDVVDRRKTDEEISGIIRN